MTLHLTSCTCLDQTIPINTFHASEYAYLSARLKLAKAHRHDYPIDRLIAANIDVIVAAVGVDAIIEALDVAAGKET